MQKHAECTPVPISGRGYLTKTLLVMKLTVTLLIAFLLNANARTVSQTVTFEGKNVSLETVFGAIEKQNDLFFLYDTELMKLAKPVHISAYREPLGQFLARLFSNQPLSFTIDHKLIVITKKKPIAPPTVAEQLELAEIPPPVLVRGRISNEKGEPVTASVAVKGTSTGTTTNADGYFELLVPSLQSVLVLSGIGIEERDVSIATYGGGELKISVNTKVTQELEAIVTGYSTQRKKDIIGSVAVVDVKALKSIPAGSALQALQGQAAGVNIVSSGSPGHASNIRIRGINSLDNVNPLVLIDGVQGNINDIPGDDVESIQVLKDAGAAAIYGVRGANGVIVVTTKKGKSGRPQTTYDSYYGIQTPVKAGFDMMSPDELRETTLKVNPSHPMYQGGVPDFSWRSPLGSGVGNTGDPQVDPSKYYFDAANPANNYIIQRYNRSGTDWFDEIFDPALMMNHNLTTSGGSDRSNYMLSLGYMNQQGTLLNTYMKRYSVRVNTQFKLRENIRVGENLYFMYRDNPQENPNHPYMSINGARLNLPFIPVYDIMGRWGGGYGGPQMGPAGNPLALRSEAGKNKNRTFGLTGNVFGEIDVLKGLTLRTSFGGNLNNFYHQTFTPQTYFHGEQFNNRNALSENSGYSALLMWTNTLTYKKDFGKHNLTALAGTEAIRTTLRNQTGGVQGFYSSNYNLLLLSGATTNISVSSVADDISFYSVFGRVDYNYDDKYLVGVTLRRDGSSSFGPQSRYGVFPSVTAGWRISNEKFMQNLHWISDLKLRASYGVLGNANNVTIMNYSTTYLQALNSSYYDINGTSTSVVQGFRPNNIGNPSAGWERNVVTNIGLDASLFRSKFDFSIEYFNKSIDGLLFPLPLPSSVIGTSTPPTVNIGDIKNTGVDVSATYHAKIGANIRLDVGANITSYKNMIKHIPTPGYVDPPWTPSNSVRNQVGHPVGSFFGYQVIGIFQDAGDVSKSPTQDGAEPGRFKYLDVNGDGAITPADRTFIGNPNPDFVYGLNIALSYKNFDFSTIFYGSQGNDIWNETRKNTDYYAGNFNKSRRLLNAWTPQNPHTGVPKLEPSGSFSTSNVANTYLIEDGSYLRMRSLLIGYNFSASGLKKAGITRLRLYAQAANLFTLTNYSGSDPEITSYRTMTFGIDEGYYPNSRNFLLGLNVGF